MSFDFHPPDLSTFDATERQKQIAAQWTRIRRIVIPGWPDAHTAWLVVGPQQLYAGDYETAEEACWMCWMLAKALETIIDADPRRRADELDALSGEICN